VVCLPLHLFLLPRGGPAPNDAAAARAAPIDTSLIL
jgi:hypothetical protein